MLKLGNFLFDDDWSGRQSCFMYFEGDEEETPSWSVHIGFTSGEFNGEDTFYIYEHEPFPAYKLKVLEIQTDHAHIQCSGILVSDGYAKPYTTEKFEIDSWLPVIESVKEWEKLGLQR